VQIKIWCGEIAQHHEMVNSAAQLHGWNQPAGVNVAIIPLPSAEERAEMRALDAKLDAIAAKLRNAAVNAASLYAKRGEFFHCRAQRLNLVVRIMLVHFGACVAGERLPDLHRHTSICHDTCERVAKTVEA